MNALYLRRVMGVAIAWTLGCPAMAQLSSQTLPLLRSPSRSFHTGNQVLSDAYRPEHTTVGDVDGDGDLDLLVAHAGNVEAPKVSVLFNLGGGSFGPPVNYAAPGQTMEAVLADLDGDGDLDASFAQSNNGSAGSRVLVYMNGGSGSFAPYVSYTVGTGPTGLVAADVDQDGDIDLISANFFWQQEDVSVLYNAGNGTFPVRKDFAIAGENPVKVAAGDLNGDGAPELVVSLDSGDPAFAVLTNDGFGNYAAPQTYSTGFAAFYQADVAVADVDNDGDNDVLYGSSTNGGSGYVNGFALFRNQGQGTFASHESIALGDDFAILYDFAVADVTGDGWPDVLGTERQSNEGFVLVPGDGSGGFGPPESFRTGEYARAVTTADLDGDGDLDAIVTNSASLTVTVHENSGAGFETPWMEPLGAYITEMGAADFDQDGDLDLVSGDFDNFYVMRNDEGSFSLETQPNPMSKAYLKLRDLDGDGALDAVFAGIGLSRALNDGAGSFGGIVSFPLGSAVGDLDTVDIDNDGDLDGVATGSAQNQSGFFKLINDGVGNFGAPTFVGSPLASKTGRVATGDFTGDGNQDVVAAAWKSIWLWQGNGAGTFAAAIERDLGEGGAADMTAADFDADGTLDIGASHWGSAPEGETLTVVFGNNNGTFTPPLTYLGMFSQWQGGVGGLVSADIDGDLDLDLVGGCRGAADVAVFLNNGDRTFAPEQRFGVDGGVTWVTSGDFDGDGRDDVAARVVNTDYDDGGVAVLLSDHPAYFKNLGHASSGSGGVPLLTGLGVPVASLPVGLSLSGVTPNAPSIFVISANRVDLPLMGGTLVPPPDLVLPFAVDAAGEFSVVTTWPPGLPTGASVYVQVWSIDVLSLKGASASNAIQITQLQ